MKRTITLPNRDNEGWLYGTRDVTVDWECPVCGQEMGEPELRNYCEDGEFYATHNWANPCGHHVNYGDLTPKEALPPFYRRRREEAICNASS